MKVPPAPATLLVLTGCLAAALSLPWPPRPALLFLAAAVAGTTTLAGLWFAGQVGLGAPLVEALASRRLLRSRDLVPLWLGLGSGLLLGLVPLFLLSAGGSRLPEVALRFRDEAMLPLHQRLAFSLSSAVLEELLFRLLSLSFLIWLLMRIFPKPGRTSPPDWTGWLAVVAVALGFGAAHLPRWAGQPGIGSSTLVLVVVLNALGGLLFGYLFWRRGLEAAIAAHATANAVLHGLGPALFA